MAIRQYIGARYVPRFMGLYDATQIYEALDVVDNGSGTSYIARKIVPAGTPLTDTDYWFVYGASSGAILDLQSRMTDAENDIDNLETGLGNTQGAVTALQTRVGNLEKHLLVIGNSYVQRNCADQLEGLFKSYKEYTYGGSGFSIHAGNNTTYEDLLDTAIADDDLDNNIITDIIFVSAFGDSWALNEYGASAYASTLSLTLADIATKIAASFPNCKRTMVTLAESRNRKFYSEADYKSVYNVHKLFKRYIPLHSMEYLGWTGWNIMYADDSYFETDDIHPTAAGAKIIGQEIVNAYFGNLKYRTIEQTKNVPFYLTSSDGTIRVDSEILPDSVTLLMGYTSITSGAPAISQNDLVVKLSDLDVPPAVLSNKYIQTDIIATNGDTRIGGMSCSLKSDSNGMAGIYLDTSLNPSMTTIASSAPKVPGWQMIHYNI